MSSSYDSPYSLCIFRRRAALLRFSRSLLYIFSSSLFFFFFQAEDGIRDWSVTWSSDVCSSDLGFGAEVKRRIMLGTDALSAGYYDAYYLKAQRVRTLLTRDFDEAFKKVDAIVTPTSPTAAFKLGEKVDDPLAMYLADIYTVTADLAGIPGISIPCGETHEKLPIGLQILGKHFDEATILRLAHAYERSSS